MAISPPDELRTVAERFNSDGGAELLLAGWMKSYEELWHEREDLQERVQRLEGELARGRAPASRPTPRRRSRARTVLAHVAFAALCLPALAAAVVMVAVVSGVYELDSSPAAPAPVARAADAESPLAPNPSPTVRGSVETSAKPDDRSASGSLGAAAVSPTTLRLTGVGDGSWVEVRRGSRSGEVLYAGVLAGGRSARFHEQRLFLRLGAPSNLRAELAGEAFTDLPRATADVVVDAEGLRVLSVG
jgi:hypothetical protein